jgi:alkylation response protein AidB-like acyl-CoA dehydrogenase
VVEGTKAFATSSTNASWAILLVDPAGPGGARHSTGSRGGVLMLACELADPAVTIDTGWWDPLGMRGTVSHVVSFDRAYIPEENLIGAPGSYFSAGWQTAFIPQYAASFLGAAEAAYEFALEYVKVHNKASDPYVHHRVGAMAVNVATGDLWLRHVAALWDAGKLAEAALAGNYARHLIEHLAEETVQHCIRACGARSLMRPSCVERILRDLTFYERHDNDDQVLATIGRSVLGEPTDLAFATPPPVPGENQV